MLEVGNANRMLGTIDAAHKPKLTHGPYTSPDVKLSDAVTCAVRGSVEVRGWHDKGAIGVPLGGVKGKRWSILVSHDLLRALRIETSRAIQFYWAVSEPTVAGWRRALGIESRATASFVQAMSPSRLGHRQDTRDGGAFARYKHQPVDD